MHQANHRVNGKNTKKGSVAREWPKAETKSGKSRAGDNADEEAIYDKKVTAEIEQALDNEDWLRARTLIRQELKAHPKSHWLWTMLGETHYEQRRYRTALKYARKAKALKPRCPVVLFQYAGTLEMTGQPRRALANYQKILDREVESVAYDECGEGLRWAMQIQNDTQYRVGKIHQFMGNNEAAEVSYRKYLHNRDHGVRSIYDRKKVEAKLAELTKEQPRKKEVAHGG